MSLERVPVRQLAISPLPDLDRVVQGAGEHVVGRQEAGPGRRRGVPVGRRLPEGRDGDRSDSAGAEWYTGLVTGQVSGFRICCDAVVQS